MQREVLPADHIRQHTIDNDAKLLHIEDVLVKYQDRALGESESDDRNHVEGKLRLFEED